jgi:hypothetical protein
MASAASTLVKSVSDKFTMRRLKQLAVAAVSLSTLSCDGCNDPPTFQAGVPALVTTLSPETQSIVQGSSGMYTVTVTRHSYTGPVTVGYVGLLPRGVTITFSPELLPEGVTTSIATVRVAADAELMPNGSPKMESIAISSVAPASGATPSQLVAQFRNLYVNVTSSVLPGVTLHALPADQLLYAGTSVESVVTVSRQGNYSGPVTLSVQFAPAGVTATIVPNGSTPDSYILKLASTLSTPETGVNPASVIIRATPVGPSDAVMTVRLVVILRRIGLTLARNSIRSVVDGQDTVTVRLNRNASVTGPVALTLQGAGGLALPAGLTGTFAENPATGETTLLTVRSTAAVAPGVYQLRVRATPPPLTDVPEEFAALSYTVAPQGGYSIAIAGVTVPQGGSASTPVVVTRTGGFAGPVTLSIGMLTGAPLLSGVTVAYEANPTTGSGTSVRFNVAATTPPGVYRLLLMATTPGLTDQGPSFDLTVTAATIGRTIVVAKRVGGSLLPTSSETVLQGTTVALEATVFDQNNLPIVGAPVTWISRNTAVATVSNTGVVTAVAQGATTVEVSLNSDPTVKATVAITVPAPASDVARIEVEPRDAKITAPATQQFLVNYFNAAGARISIETGGSLQFLTSNSTVADINAASGLATGKTAGSTNITARYLRNGQFVAQDVTSLTVAAAGTAGNYGSLTFSIQGGTRDLRLAHGYTFQLIVRDPAGNQVTSGVTPAPTYASSNPLVTVAPSEPPPGAPPGYYFSLNVPANATVGSTVQIRYDVAGAGGAINLTIVP